MGLREEGYKGNKLSVLSLLSQTSAVKTTPRPNTFRCVTACGSVSERRCGTTCSSVDGGPSSNTDNPSEPLTSLGGKGVLGASAQAGSSRSKYWSSLGNSHSLQGAAGDSPLQCRAEGKGYPFLDITLLGPLLCFFHSCQPLSGILSPQGGYMITWNMFLPQTLLPTIPQASGTLTGIV